MIIVSLPLVILHCARNFESLLFLFLVSQNFEMQVANDIKSSGSNLFSWTRDINSGKRFRAPLLIYTSSSSHFNETNIEQYLFNKASTQNSSQ